MTEPIQSTELIIPQQHAYVREIKHDDVTIKDQECLRVYRYSPTGLHIQVRAHCQLQPTVRARMRDLIGGVTLNVEQAKLLRAKLDEFINSIEGK